MTTYNTGNPIGSTEVKDLYDNAENLDIAINSPSADVWTDRLGQARKTWRGIQNEAQLEIAQVVGEVTAQSQQYLDASIVARDEARAAASASGPIAFFGTYAAAQAAVGGLPDGGIVEVSQDETRAGARTRYKVQAGALVFVVNLDQARVDLAAATGASIVGYLPAGTGAVATTVQEKLMEVVSVLDFGAVGDGVTDDAAAIQAAVNASKYVFFPPASSYYKTLSTITIPLGRHLIGAQQTQTIIGAWGCDAFTINGASGDHVTIEGIEFRGYSALGVIDAKTHTGVKSCGTGANHVNYLKIRSCFFRGWLYCIDWQYTWNSTLDDVDTLNCTNGLRLFGQSVNNSIVKSRIGANGGNASILTVKDGAIKGEGLMVSGSVLASGNFGISSDGFLSLSVVGCVVDLIQDKAFDLTNCQAFTLSSSWVYAENFGVNFNTLGVSVDQGASITGCYITVVASGGKAIYVGGQNVGVSITGGSLTCGTNGRLVHVDGSAVSVVGVTGVNTGANPSILFAGLDCVARANTGSMAVQWVVGVQSQGGVAVATLSFNGLTGAALFANGCSITRTGVGAYRVTFTYPLVSASYIPMVTLDRGGNGAIGYAIVSQSTTGFSFTVTNAAGTPNDVGVGWIAVFN